MCSIYQPAEDSRLLLNAALDFLKKNKPESIIEVGTGSGFIINSLAQSCSSRLFATEISKPAAKGLRTRAKAVLADGLSGLKRFGLILFNPPYLPPTEDDRFLGELEPALINKGVIERFIRSLPDHLTPQGRALLLLSDLSGRPRLETLMKASGLEFSVVAQYRQFFERLYVYRLRVKSQILAAAPIHKHGRH